MKTLATMLLLCLSLSFYTEEFAQSQTLPHNKAYYEDLLRTFLEFGVDYNNAYYSRPKSWEPYKFEDMIDKSVFYAWLHNYDYIANKFNAPLKNMELGNDLYFIPNKYVKEALCMFFGYSINKNKDLEEAFNKNPRHFGDVFLLDMGMGGDSTSRQCKIKHITKLENGLIRMDGTWGENETFKSYFSYFYCSKKPILVPIKIVVNEIPEEKADYDYSIEDK